MPLQLSLIPLREGAMPRSINLIDLAPTMARVLGVKTPPLDGTAIDLVEGWGCDRVILGIVDSLGYGLYRALEPDLPVMRSMAEEGLILRAESVASSTTPAIASILTGLTPENHGINNTAQACESEMRSLLEMGELRRRSIGGGDGGGGGQDLRGVRRSGVGGSQEPRRWRF